MSYVILAIVEGDYGSDHVYLLSADGEVFLLLNTKPFTEKGEKPKEKIPLPKDWESGAEIKLPRKYLKNFYSSLAKKNAKVLTPFAYLQGGDV